LAPNFGEEINPDPNNELPSPKNYHGFASFQKLINLKKITFFIQTSLTHTRHTKILGVGSSGLKPLNGGWGNKSLVEFGGKKVLYHFIGF
jgi:hypothetical protein